MCVCGRCDKRKEKCDRYYWVLIIYLSSEEAYLGDVGPAPVPGLNAPEEESKLFVSGFISNGLWGPMDETAKFVSRDRPGIHTKIHRN